MDLIAYALRSDYSGTVEIDGVETPRFGGGVLWVGDGDFHVRDTLDEGDGVIVIRATDMALAGLLDVYPALKRVPVPEQPAAIVSPHERLNVEQLRHRCQLHGVDVPRTGRGSTRARLIEALDAKFDGEPAPVRDDVVEDLDDDQADDDVVAPEDPDQQTPEPEPEPAPVDPNPEGS